jgi:hypothetical protein
VEHIGQQLLASEVPLEAIPVYWRSQNLPAQEQARLPRGFSHCRLVRRGLATRYEKRAANYRALVVIASIAIWLQS